MTTIGFTPFDGCTALETMVVLSDRLEAEGALIGFSSGPAQVVRGCAGSRVEQYYRENKITFEALSEDQQDSVLDLTDIAYDVFEGLPCPGRWATDPRRNSQTPQGSSWPPVKQRAGCSIRWCNPTPRLRISRTPDSPCL